ncbi:putative Cenp-O kinetochore centromere component [Seiridium cardinale]|uniref:Cenp-O kinetochore centromere component n=1 Tax=Seiridium cardinale TaxID=138064 RepID=A0ABR2XR84_9PEZI
MTSRTSLSPDLSVADRLDDEIAKLRAQVESLKNELKLQTTTLLTRETTRELLEDSTLNAFEIDASIKSRLLAQCDKQVAHQQQSLYRACASITALKIRDPDPKAVDGGNVLGMRFEVMSRSRFIRPYYVMLNRPYPESRHLRVHRHTVPPCIPLSGLAARHLPAPKPDARGRGTQDQDLSKFARALRRELVRYQNRIATISDLRKAAGQGSTKGRGRELDIPISEISAVDAEAKQVRLEWEDGRTGRLVMDDDGKILKVVAQRENERDRQRVRELLGGSTHVEELVRHLGPDQRNPKQTGSI